MLVVVDVTELIAHDSCVANSGVDVRVGMAIDPDVDAAVCNGGEGSIKKGTFVQGGHNGLTGQVVGDNNDMFGSTLFDRLL